MQEIKIHAQSRIRGKALLHKLRRQGMVPAVLYGHGFENQSLALNLGTFKKVFGSLGESTLIDLVINDGQPVKALVCDIQRHPLTSEAVHIDFRQINMDEEIETEIALELSGESPAVKALGAILVKSLEAIKVKCLPSLLVDKILVDISGLANFGERIFVKDISVPEGMKVLESPDLVAASVAEPEEETVVETGPATVAEVQKVGEEKKEGEEGAPAAEAAAAKGEAKDKGEKK